MPNPGAGRGRGGRERRNGARGRENARGNAERAPITAVQRLEALLGKLREQSHRFRDGWQAGEASRVDAIAGQVGEVARGGANPVIAKELEAMLLQEEAETSAMCEKVEALIQLCRRRA
jgi:hypothetical protein